MIGAQVVMVNVETRTRPHWVKSWGDWYGTGMGSVSWKDEDRLRLSIAEKRLPVTYLHA